MNDSKKGMAMKIVVNVLAVIGGIAVLSVIGMALVQMLLPAPVSRRHTGTASSAT